MPKHDIIVVGGGLAGLSLTALLATYDFKVLCLDQAPAAAHGDQQFDVRTTAIAAAGQDYLAQAGVWPSLEPDASPILDIRVTDNGSPSHVHFNHHEVGRPFGWIIENHLLRRALHQRVAALPNATLQQDSVATAIETKTASIAITIQQGNTQHQHQAALVVGADGKHSFCRDYAKIPCYGADYWQSAVVCAIHHSLPHNQVAVEDFLSGGPLATLPMTQQRSSIVWTQPHAAAELLQTMSAADFCAWLKPHLGMMLGDIRLASERGLYRLGRYHAARYTAPRLALVAEAAHTMHPIAGQGLNISLRDNLALCNELLAARRLGLDLGSATVLAGYSRTRRADTTAMLAATDGLDRLFSNAIPGLGLLRRAGLGMVNKSPALKQFFMRAAMGQSKSL